MAKGTFRDIFKFLIDKKTEENFSGLFYKATKMAKPDLKKKSQIFTFGPTKESLPKQT